MSGGEERRLSENEKRERERVGKGERVRKAVRDIRKKKGGKEQRAHELNSSSALPPFDSSPFRLTLPINPDLISQVTSSPNRVKIS